MDKRRKKQIIILAGFIVLLIAVNYSLIDNFLEDALLYESAKVGRIIDGDTLVIENGDSVRLLGINCPEKGEKYYEEAKDFLEQEVFNRTIKLRFGKERHDRYGRTLAYIFFDNENINLKLVENGLANYYFPSGKDNHYGNFVGAWERCIDKGINLCKASDDKCADCIILKELDIKNQKAVFYNNCSFSCNLEGWTIKDEGRKKFTFPKFVLEKGSIVGVTTEDFEEDYVWTDTGDTLFLRDKEDGLVLWKSVS